MNCLHRFEIIFEHVKGVCDAHTHTCTFGHEKKDNNLCIQLIIE